MAGVKKMENAKATVIYLDQVMHEEVKRAAANKGISMAEFIRGVLTRELGQSYIASKRAWAKRKAGAA
jgi:predicted HicB family RNase H-like nuclease